MAGNNTSNRRTDGRGFTLMEILAALVLIGVVLPAVMKGLSIASILASDSARKYEALDLAESKLAEVLLSGQWQSGAGSGDFMPDYDGYEWTLETSDWTQAAVKQVSMTVYWEQRGRLRQIQLATLVYETQ